LRGPEDGLRLRNPSRSNQRIFTVVTNQSRPNAKRQRARVDDNGGPEPTDEALLAGMALGDEDSTVVFVRRYQRRVYGLALGIVSDRAAAEDVAQEALLRAWRHSPVFDARRGSVENWLLTITRNLSIDALRKQRSIPFDPNQLVALARASHTGSLEDSVATRSLRPAILNALAEISPEQRRAVLFASLYGRTAQEICEIEGIPLGTAKTRIRAGLSRLRSVLVSEVEGSA
jgi:RNA polymerase sigma factor (sigma-70 family)